MARFCACKAFFAVVSFLRADAIRLYWGLQLRDSAAFEWIPLERISFEALPVKALPLLVQEAVRVREPGCLHGVTGGHHTRDQAAAGELGRSVYLGRPKP